MFNFRKKDQFEFGMISPNDDADIKEVNFKKVARRDYFVESMRVLRDIFLIIVMFVLFGVFVAQPVVVEGTSMMPHLKEGERLIVNKLVYYQIKSVRWGHLERGDIVVFWYPNNPNKSYVKRIIGLPGEMVEIKDGKVHIDDKILDEPYLASEYNQHPRKIARNMPRKIDPHHYFVMGDNRDDSSDSRDWGVVPEKYIYGKVFFRYWGPSSVGFVGQWEYESDIEPMENDDRANDAAPE